MKNSVYNNGNSKVVNFVEYLFVLVMILNANTIWTSYDESPMNRILKVAVVVVGMAYIFIQKSLPKKAFENILLSLVIGICYAFVYFFIGGYKPMGFVYLICTVIAVYSFLQIANIRGRAVGIFFKYKNIILIVAIISIFFWVFGSTLGIISPTGYEYTTWGGHTILLQD